METGRYGSCDHVMEGVKKKGERGEVVMYIWDVPHDPKPTVQS